MTTEQFEQVYKKLFDPMVDYSSRKYFGLDFESVVQEAFLVVWKKKESYKQNKESSIWGTLNNVIKTRLRSNKRNWNKLEAYKKHAESIYAPAEEGSPKPDLFKNLSLNEKDKKLYNMLYVEGVKPPEAAKRLGVSVGALYVRKSRLNEKVKQKFLVDKT
jgi:RNA polymerase sigma factor (sigma-70 family)